MSLDATRWAWMQPGLRPIQKLILLALADRENGHGMAYPSHAALVEDTGADLKTVKKSLKELADMGLISDSGDRKGHTKQIIVWGLIGVERRESKGAKNGRVPETEGFQFSHESSPKVDGKGVQKRTTESINEPIKEPNKKDATFSSTEMPEIEPSLAAEFLAYRKAKKSPLTPTAWKGIQREAEKAGWSITEAVEETMTRGWQSFKADWVAQTKTSGAASKRRHVVNPVRAA